MKAKISTSAGTFEFEGDDVAVKEQIKAVLELSATVQPNGGNSTGAAPKVTTKKKNTGTKTKRSSGQPKMLPTLLSGRTEVDSLRQYYEEKQPVTHIEKFAVLTLWLKNNKQMESSSIDEMWTLYKVLSLRQPKSMIQTFRDGKSKKSYFESADDGRYFITSFGETFVDHDLPHQKGVN